MSDTELGQDELRQRALERDDYQCQYCNHHAPDGIGLNVHHVHRRVDGGPDTLANVITLCQNHHDAVHTFGDGERRPLRILEEHDVPKEVPDIRGLDNCLNVTVFNAFRDHAPEKHTHPWGRMNPLHLREQTNLKKGQVHRALRNLTTAGWIRQVNDGGLYEFVADPREDE